jgi:hypothetical protein
MGKIKSIQMKNIIDQDGNKFYYLNDLLHREDGPAIECSNGDKYWCIDGKYHREDGPAVERADGYKSWWVNDKRHRSDGPAIEYANGGKEWYYHGEKIYCKSQREFEQWIKLRAFK